MQLCDNTNSHADLRKPPDLNQSAALSHTHVGSEQLSQGKPLFSLGLAVMPIVELFAVQVIYGLNSVLIHGTTTFMHC